MQFIKSHESFAHHQVYRIVIVNLHVSCACLESPSNLILNTNAKASEPGWRYKIILCSNDVEYCIKG